MALLLKLQELQSSHLDEDHSRRVIRQVAAPSLQLPSEQEASADSLQTEHQGLAVPPQAPAREQA